MLKGYGKAPAQILELPDTAWITPSKHNPWRGAKEPGARFTYHQLRVMRQCALDPDSCETVRVYDRVRLREMWWPDTQEAPIYAFSCPVLEIRPRGFRLVISPSGDREIVHESGFIKGRTLPKGAGRLLDGVQHDGVQP